MEHAVLAFPVKPGATAEEIESITTMFKTRPDEYRESRDRLGISLERAYHQPTPMGDFVVVYEESESSAGATVGMIAASDLAIDKDFVRMALELHGVDITAPPQGAPPETVGVWTAPDGSRGRGMAFCVPFLPGRADAGRSFSREAYETRRDEMTASRLALAQTAEVVTLLDTPMGQIGCIYLEGPDPVESNRLFAASDAPFDRWFKEQLATLFPPQVDFNQPVPPVREIFDSEA